MKIRDPRDRRRFLILLSQHNMLGKDRSAWADKSGKISVYRSQDAPKCEGWIFDIDGDYREYMTY